MGREVDRVFRMGNTCTLKVDSSQYMAIYGNISQYMAKTNTVL